MENLKRALNESAPMRWGILLFVSFVMAANYYFYDAFSPIQSVLEAKLGWLSEDYGIMQSFYSFPNTFLIMAILGGIILDRWGIRVTGMLFVGFMSLGGLIMAYGVSDVFLARGPGYHLLASFWPDSSPELKIMSLGFLMFGLGAETSIVVINKIMVKWFKGKEIALAFALNLAVARIGSFLAFRVQSRIAGPEGSDWQLAVWFASLLLIVAFFFFLVYVLFDVKIDRQLQAGMPVDPKEKFKLSDVLDLFKNRAFILITLLCLSFYSAVFPFVKYASDFFLNKWGLSLEASGDYTSWLFIGAIIFTPIFGSVVDWKGKSATLMIFGSVLLILVHGVLAFTNLNPVVPIIILGIAFSLVPAAMWPAVAKIVDENRIGTAYGIMFSIQNLGLWGIPLIAGKIVTKTPQVMNQVGNLAKDYTWTIILFGLLGFLGLLFSLLLKAEDKRKKLALDLPSNQLN
jgi:MFS family permease